MLRSLPVAVLHAPEPPPQARRKESTPFPEGGVRVTLISRDIVPQELAPCPLKAGCRASSGLSLGQLWLRYGEDFGPRRSFPASCLRAATRRLLLPVRPSSPRCAGQPEGPRARCRRGAPPERSRPPDRHG